MIETIIQAVRAYAGTLVFTTSDSIQQNTREILCQGIDSFPDTVTPDEVRELYDVLESEYDWIKGRGSYLICKFEQVIELVNQAVDTYNKTHIDKLPPMEDRQ